MKFLTPLLLVGAAGLGLLFWSRKAAAESQTTGGSLPKSTADPASEPSGNAIASNLLETGSGVLGTLGLGSISAVAGGIVITSVAAWEYGQHTECSKQFEYTRNGFRPAKTIVVTGAGLSEINAARASLGQPALKIGDKFTIPAKSPYCFRDMADQCKKQWKQEGLKGATC